MEPSPFWDRINIPPAMHGDHNLVSTYAECIIFLPESENHLTRQVTRRVSLVSCKKFTFAPLSVRIHTFNYLTYLSSSPAVFIMDRRTPYTISVLPSRDDGAEDTRTKIQAKLREFVLGFQLDNAFIYRWDICCLDDPSLS